MASRPCWIFPKGLRPCQFLFEYMAARLSPLAIFRAAERQELCGSHVSKSNPTNSNQAVSVAASTPPLDAVKPTIISGTEVKSPIIGTAYLAAEPGAKKFAEVGKKIKKGETVMIVEAMKTMNHVPSTADGVIKEICVEDGQPVEYGQTIIIVE